MNAPNPMKAVCAWCKKVLRDGTEPITHSICPACKDRMLARTLKAIAYAMPIGGGWAHFCAECFAAHRADPESDPEAVADCEPIHAFPAGIHPCCEICAKSLVKHDAIAGGGA